jgi:hypothetical protein
MFLLCKVLFEKLMTFVVVLFVGNAIENNIKNNELNK